MVDKTFFLVKNVTFTIKLPKSTSISLFEVNRGYGCAIQSYQSRNRPAHSNPSVWIDGLFFSTGDPPWSPDVPFLDRIGVPTIVLDRLADLTIPIVDIT